MGLDKYMIVFDFETDGLDTKTCTPVQIAAMAVDLRNLEIVSGSEFNIAVRPDKLKLGKEYYDHADHKRTIKWHADIWKKPVEEILETWKRGIPEKDAWGMFVDYTKKYRFGNAYDQTPISGGQNIKEYDLKICETMKERHKGVFPFSKTGNVDLMDLTALWFMFSSSPPKNLKLDTLRDYFGMSKENAHDALQDVKDCTKLILKFLTLHRNITPQIEALNLVQEIEV